MGEGGYFFFWKFKLYRFRLVKLLNIGLGFFFWIRVCYVIYGWFVGFWSDYVFVVLC